MKKILAVVLVVVMVLSLTACGGGLSTGKYYITSYKMGDTDLASLLSDDQKKEMYIEIVDDKNAKICFGDGDVGSCTYDGSNFIMGDEKLPYTVSGGKISIKEEASGVTMEMVFAK